MVCCIYHLLQPLNSLILHSSLRGASVVDFAHTHNDCIAQSNEVPWVSQVQQTLGMGAQGIMGGSGVTPPTPLQPMSSGCASSLDGRWV